MLLTSQYLNLTKNSSLAVAIAYPELVSVFAGTALNQVGREVEMIFMMALVYLTFSLITSLFMNWFNHRIKLVEKTMETKYSFVRKEIVSEQPP